MKRTARHPFVLLETVAALGLVALILVGVYAGIHVNERMLQRYLSQRQALDVLDNVVERLAVEAPVTLPRCAAVLAEELAPSPLAGKPGVRSGCERVDGSAIRCTLRDHGHLLAEIRIGRRE
jgi:hypothetical protein